MGQGLAKGALDVGQDAQILLGAPPQLGIATTQLQGAVESLPGASMAPLSKSKPASALSASAARTGSPISLATRVAPFAELAGQGRWSR